MSTIILLKSTRVFHRTLNNEGIFNFKLLFMNNRLLFSYCFLDGGEQSHDGEIPPFPYYIKTLSTLPVSLKMAVKLQYMSHKCNCMAFVIAVLFSITDSRLLTSQKELRT